MKTRAATGRKHSTDITIAVGILWLVASLLSAAPASATTIENQRPLLFSSDGSDTTAGAFTQPQAIAIDQASGDVYVLNMAAEPEKRVIDKFNAQGEALAFTAGNAAGRSSLDGSETPAGAFGVEGFFGTGSPNADVAIDNSSANPGRIYVSEAGGPIWAFNPDGTYIPGWKLPRATIRPCGIAVDGEGHLWVVDGSSPPKMREFAASGSPPAEISAGTFTLESNGGATCFPAVDQSGNEIYVDRLSHPVEKYVDGIFDSTPDPHFARDTALDPQAGGHLFTLPNRNGYNTPGAGFAELDAAGDEVAGSPFGGDLIGEAEGIAHNRAKDWVYVSDSETKTVKVFGPATSGPAPDASCGQTDAVTRTTANAHCTINPQGLENEYRFEWAPGGEEVQHLSVGPPGNKPLSGTFRVGVDEPCCPEHTEALPFDVSPAALQAALEGLGSIGTGNVAVSGTPSDGEGSKHGDYDITFTADLAGVDVPPLLAESTGLSGKVFISTPVPGPRWTTAKSSAPLSIEPSDSSPHARSLALTQLKQNSPYSVRLAATNTGNHLTTYSKPDVFATLPPPAAKVEDCEVLAIATESAHLSCAIDSEEDTTSWRILRSALPDASQAQCEALNEGKFDKVEVGTIPAEEAGTVAIETDLTGLKPAETSCVRVIAVNGNPQPDSKDLHFRTLAVAPTAAEAAFAAPRTDTTARINARVDPEGEADLSYRFELSEDAGASWTALPIRQSTANSHSQIVVAEELSGLAPDTTYTYRLGMVENEAGPAPSPGPAKSFTTRATGETHPPDPCPNEAVRTAQHSASYLGSCRGIELVNKPEDGNQNVFAFTDEKNGTGVTADGSRILWFGFGGTPGGPNGTQSPFLAERGPTGWTSQSIAPPAAEQIGGGSYAYKLLGATPDLETYVLNAARFRPFTSPSPPNLVRIHRGDPQQLLKSYQGGEPGDQFLYMIDFSADAAHVLFVDPASRQLEDIGGASPQLVSLMPDGNPSECGLDALTGASFPTVSSSGPASNQYHFGYHAVAATDASRVYFEVQEDGACQGPVGLYVRNREANKGKGKTILIDSGVGGASSFGGKAPEFIRAAADGRRAFFLSSSRLDPADQNFDPDVYRWDETIGKTGASVCLTCTEGVSDAKVDGRLVVSDDGSHVYFESEAALIPGQGRAGDANLYVAHGGGIRFLADAGNTNDPLGSNESALSSDGEVLLFRALASPALTSDRTAAECLLPDDRGPEVRGGCAELYRYDDRDGGLECISCRHDGITTHAIGTPLPSDKGLDFKLSADGSTAAFVTQEDLLPRDVNQTTDVYEWRGGSAHLLTDGVSESHRGISAPKVWAIDADGSDIFFGVVPPGGSLTGFERSALANLYDARIGGGFEPPPPVSECEGDACQGPLSAPPPPGRPASASFAGRGDAAGRRRCRRGQIRVGHRGGARCNKPARHRHRKHEHRRGK